MSLLFPLSKSPPLRLGWNAVYAIFLLLPTLLAFSAPASALTLKPFKDELFAYPALLSSEKGDRYRVFDYRELRDINQRDEAPERRAHAKYVALGVRRAQQDLVFKGDAGEVRHFAVGSTENA